MYHSRRGYAKGINGPALLLYGAKDKRVRRQEVEEIHKNLNEAKEFIIFPNAAHEPSMVLFNLMTERSRRALYDNTMSEGTAQADGQPAFCAAAEKF